MFLIQPIDSGEIFNTLQISIYKLQICIAVRIICYVVGIILHSVSRWYFLPTFLRSMQKVILVIKPNIYTCICHKVSFIDYNATPSCKGRQSRNKSVTYRSLVVADPLIG